MILQGTIKVNFGFRRRAIVVLTATITWLSFAQAVFAQQGGTANYFYDTLSRRTSLSRPNGVTTSYQYDEVNRLKRLTHTNASSVTLEDLQYEFNLDDEINRITSLAAAPLTPQSKTVTPADAANRIGQFGGASFGFNAEGQTTSKADASGTTAYQWDARGRLTQATLPGGQMVS